jgi:hypothetical protein
VGANNDRNLEVTNHSSGTVIGYQLGCVVEKANKIKVENRFPAGKLKSELDPADPLDKMQVMVITRIDVMLISDNWNSRHGWRQMQLTLGYDKI